MEAHSAHRPDDGDWPAKRRITLAGAAVNVLLAAGKIVGGIFGQSQALIVDGVHSASDLTSDAVVMWAARIGSMAPDRNHPYGHERFETAATLAVGALLLLVAGGFAYDALSRLLEPERLRHPGWLALGVAIASVVAKEAIYRYTARVARRLRSRLLEANAWHHRSDALSSIVVILGVLGAMAGLPWLDAVAALVVALMVGAIGWKLGWHAGAELVDTGADAVTLQEIADLVRAVDGVRAHDALRTRQMGPKLLVEVRVHVDPAMSVADAAHVAERVAEAVRGGMEQVSRVAVRIAPAATDP